MELKEAIEMVSEACYHYDRELYENCNYSEAFDTVLEELDNRIPIKKIKKVLEELDERAIYPNKCNYYARLTVSEALFLKHFIENEILNKE